jgi:hypothetical protein
MNSITVNICGKDVEVRGRLVRTAALRADMFEFFDNPAAALDAVAKCGRRVDLFTFVQPLHKGTHALSFPMEWDNLAVLPVSTFEQWWAERLDNKTRNMVRKAQRSGVETREVPFDEDFVRGVWEIYNECPLRQGKPFAHYGADLEAVRREVETLQHLSYFIGAFYGGALIGFLKVIRDDTGLQAGLANVVSMVRHRDKAPTNALVAEAVRSCVARGIRHLVYSRFCDGNKERDSLMDFKEHNGFERINLPRYYVALTHTGRAVLRLGLHKGISEHVPEPLLALGRKLRREWHMRRQATVAGGSRG